MDIAKCEPINNFKSQPRPILKKSPSRSINKNKPLFFTGDLEPEDLDYNEKFSKTESENIIDFKNLNLSPPINDRFRKSSFGYISRSLKYKRKSPSTVYIFHRSEINKEIIKSLLNETDGFIDEFKQKSFIEINTDKDLINNYKNIFLPKLKDFLLNDKNYSEYNYEQPMNSYDLGATLSEPTMLDVERFRKKFQNEKLAASLSTILIGKTFNEADSDNEEQNKFDQSITGSLPNRSFFDSFNKELKIKEEALLKTIRSKSIVSSPNKEDIINSSAAMGKNSKEKNKSIVSTATTTKKIVRFADAFGLDLEKIKIITNNSFVDVFSQNYVENEIEENESDTKTVSKPFLVLIPLFSIRKVSDLPIKLDDYVYDYENKIIKCMIKVKNLSYQKRVFSRITFNNWKSFYDLDAIYVKSENLTNFNNSTVTKSASGLLIKNSYDYFGFCIVIPEKNSESSIEDFQKKNSIGESILRIEFALCYIENENTYWDNNSGENYKFQCFFNINK